MKIPKFFIFLLVLVGLATAWYFFSTDRTSETVLIGIVDANQVIVSSKIMGRVEKLYVDEGSKVKAGDLIAEIDSAELEAEKNAAAAMINAGSSQVSSTRATEAQTLGETNSGVVNAQARLAAAQATLAQAQADLVRIQSDSQRTIALAKAGVASEQDSVRADAQLKAQQAVVQSSQKTVDAAQADVNTAEARLHQQRAAASNVAMNQAQVANAKAQLAEAETRLGYTKVYAPVSGTVSVRATRQGEVVNPGSAIVTIVDFGDTWVRAEAPETEGRFVAVGDKLKVRLPAGNPIEGEVIFKAVEGDYATQRDVSRRKRDIKTIGLKLKVDNPDGALVPGMTAEVLLPKELEKEGSAMSWFRSKSVSSVGCEAPTNGDAIVVDHIVKKYGDFTAVNDVSFSVKQGEIFGLLGPNGAGKSTLIRMMTTLLPITAGQALINGHDVAKEPDAARNCMGVIPQALTSDIDLTVEENLNIYAKLYDVPADRRKRNIDDLLETVDLTKWRHAQTKTLSGGMRRRLEIARGLVHSPKIFFLDEPTTGLDPVSRVAVWEMLTKIKNSRDLTVLITTHYMDEADRLCDRIAIVDHGKLVALDAPIALKASVPGSNVIEAQFLNAPENWEEELRQLDDVTSVQSQAADMYRVLTSNGSKTTTELVELAVKQNVQVKSLSVQNTTLDDVFVHFTGRQLRDEQVKAFQFVMPDRPGMRP